MYEDPSYLGATIRNEQTEFLLWAPHCETVDLILFDSNDKELPPMKMQKIERGYFKKKTTAPAGTRYLYLLNDEVKRPDPASRYQPQGVHGPSQVIETDFPWEDLHWQNIPLQDYLFYELHVGTFSAPGSFSALRDYIDYFKELGITSLELMPVAQFPGRRNWGYDGVYPYAVQASYGDPNELKKLINACHKEGIAVTLDVVYNHLGPEGNYLRDFGPYFSAKYQTPWGEAINFDDAYSDEVRRFFIENALMWLRDFHVDALRLDAVHAIYDQSPYSFIEELQDHTARLSKEVGRPLYLIAESSDNNARLIRSQVSGGYNLSAQWSDDFHHSLHTLLTQEKEGYYQDYGDAAHLQKAFQSGFVYTGEFSPFRNRRHGSPVSGISNDHFVVCSQNHDQVGNKMKGERPTEYLSFEQLKLSAGATLLSPYLPLLFMGEEYGEIAPFQYFIEHSDPELIRAVQEGRKSEFSSFLWKEEPPDPQSIETFQRSKLKHGLREEEKHKALFSFYKKLIELSKEQKKIFQFDPKTVSTELREKERILEIHYQSNQYHDVIIWHFGSTGQTVEFMLPASFWDIKINSASSYWLGPDLMNIPHVKSLNSLALEIFPHSFMLLRKREAIHQ